MSTLEMTPEKKAETQSKVASHQFNRLPRKPCVSEAQSGPLARIRCVPALVDRWNEGFSASKDHLAAV